MTTLFCSLRGIVPACCVVAAAVSCSAFAEVLQGRCVAVADGDTATIVFEGGKKESVRFWGIDAPESYQAFGQEGKKKLASMIKGKEVRVEFSSRDHHKRILGHVYCGEVYTNLEMVKAGLAWHYVQYAPNATEFRDAERAARKARLGLWQQADPMEPWLFRHPTPATITHAAEQAGKPEAAAYKFWISNSGKTHNIGCKQFLGNSGSGRYSNTPSGNNAGCCGGAK